MCKKKWIKPVITIVAVVILLAGICVTAMGIFSTKGYSISVGKCLVVNNNSYLVVDSTPIYMSGDDKHFKNLQNGDKLIVLHGYVEETYPARTGVYWLKKYGSGDTQGLDEILKSLYA